MVGKVNFASSAQSHKIGSTALFNDLFKAVCGGNSITNTEGFENCRVAVLQNRFCSLYKKMRIPNHNLNLL